jgi:hypothetical protein
MNWLSADWIWVAAAIALFLVMRLAAAAWGIRAIGAMPTKAREPTIVGGIAIVVVSLDSGWDLQCKEHTWIRL